MNLARIALTMLAPAALLLSACGGEGGAQTALGDEKPQDRALGDPDAPVTIIEYASTTCPVCKSWHEQVWPRVRQELVETGQVRYIFRELPTGPMDVSMASFLIARCVPENRYFSVIDTLFDRQERLVQSPDRRGELLAVARAAGLSEDQFNACIRDEAEIARINEWVEEAAVRYRINSTPSFVVNGRVIVGAQPFETFQQAVEEATGQPLPADDGED